MKEQSPTMSATLEQSRTQQLRTAAETPRGRPRGRRPAVHRLLPARRHRGPAGPRARGPARRRVEPQARARPAARRSAPPTSRVFNPTVDEHGWSTGHTVVEIVTDDMPFLVDSVTAELGPRGPRHRTWWSTRSSSSAATSTGTLVEVLDAGAGRRASSGSSPRVVDPRRDRPRAERPTSSRELTAELRRVLADVREAVEDWPQDARAAPRASPTTLPSHPPVAGRRGRGRGPPRLLEWLADDHFTFLGYREYDLDRGATTQGDRPALRAVPGTGLGILRADPPASRAFAPALARGPREGPRAAPARPHQGELALDRAPPDLPRLRRRQALRRAAARSTGERRFLGLFTSSAYTQSVRDDPGPAAQGRRGARARPGFAPDSHAGKDLLQILETYPRDELFQIDAGRVLPTSRLQVLHLQERRQVRAVPAPRRLRPLHVLPGLPAARPLHHGGPAADRGDPARRRSTAEPSTTPRWCPSRCSPGCTSSCGCRRATPLPEVDAAGARGAARRRRPARGPTTSARRSGRPSARSARRGCSGCYATAFPEAYKEDFAAATRSPTSRRIEALRRRRRGRGRRSTRRRAPSARRAPVQGLPRRRADRRCSRCCRSCTRLGVEVVDERPYELDAQRRHRRVYIYDFGLRARPASSVADAATSIRERFEDAFARRVARRGRDRRLQRAGARRRADLAAGRRAARATRSTCARPARRSARTTSSSALRRATPASPRCSSSCSRPGSTRTLRRATGRACAADAAGRGGSGPRSTPWRASTRTGSCARSSR